MACASAGKRDMMNQSGHGGDVPVAKRRRCVEPAGAAAAGIPEDIAEQILLRLPVKSILRFRSVCKSWRAMVADPRFVRLQLHHSTTAARHRPPSMLVLPHWSMPELRMGTIGFFRYPGHGAAAELAHERAWSSIVSDDYGAAAADWAADDDADADDDEDTDADDDGDAADGRDCYDDWDQPLHCNGLVLLCSVMKNSTLMLVCNPATKEIAELPACTPDYFTEPRVGFYADQSTGKIKVVHCFIRQCDETCTDYSVGCEVLSLGSPSPAWRPVADPPYLLGFGPASPCILGGIYWIASLPSPPTGSCTAPGMLRFDVRNEEFADFPCPPCMDVFNTTRTMTELAGKLCYSHLAAGDKIELWIASAAADGDEDEGGGGPSWSLHCAVVLPQPINNIFPFADDYQGGGVFFNVHFAVICRYDTERQVVEHVVDMNNEMTYFRSRSTHKLYDRNRVGGKWMHHVIPYRESLVSIKAN
uniref:F-box domain-containing protein n=1 Tax=Oryza punctata TaxID=4537 RepID=A0A0E0L8F0_ORYPU